MSGDDRLRAPPVPQRREPAVPTAELIPPAHGGLLARLDILVNLLAGLAYAAWCHRVPWPQLLDGTPAVAVLREGRTWVLRLLFRLPAGVEVDLGGFVDAVADRLHLPAGEWLLRAVAAVFLDPLVALGVAEIDPRSPRLPARARFSDRAETVIGSALIAAGEDLPLSRAG